MFDNNDNFDIDVLLVYMFFCFFYMAYIYRDANLLTQKNRLCILKNQILERKIRFSRKLDHYQWPVGPGPVRFQKNVILVHCERMVKNKMFALSLKF